MFPLPTTGFPCAAVQEKQRASPSRPPRWPPRSRAAQALGCLHLKVGEEARVIACWRVACGEFDVAPSETCVVLGVIDEEGVVHRLNRVLSLHDHRVFCARELEA